MKDIPKRVMILAALVLSSLPVVNAFSISSSLGRVGQTFISLTNNYYVMYIASFIFVFIILYGAFAAGLARVSAFSDSGKLSEYGKKVVLGLSLMSSLGIIWGFKSQYATVMRVLTTFGWFGMVVMMALPFALVYFNFRKDDKKDFVMAMAAAGLGLYMYGQVTNSEEAKAWGVVLLLIFGIWAFVRMAEGGGSGGGGGSDRKPKDERKPKGKDKEPEKGPQKDPEVPADFSVGINKVEYNSSEGKLRVEGEVKSNGSEKYIVQLCFFENLDKFREVQQKEKSAKEVEPMWRGYYLKQEVKGGERFELVWEGFPDQFWEGYQNAGVVLAVCCYKKKFPEKAVWAGYDIRKDNISPEGVPSQEEDSADKEDVKGKDTYKVSDVNFAFKGKGEISLISHFTLKNNSSTPKKIMCLLCVISPDLKPRIKSYFRRTTSKTVELEGNRVKKTDLIHPVGEGKTVELSSRGESNFNLEGNFTDSLSKYLQEDWFVCLITYDSSKPGKWNWDIEKIDKLKSTEYETGKLFELTVPENSLPRSGIRGTIDFYSDFFEKYVTYPYFGIEISIKKGEKDLAQVYTVFEALDNRIKIFKTEENQLGGDYLNITSKDKELIFTFKKENIEKGKYDIKIKLYLIHNDEIAPILKEWSATTKVVEPESSILRKPFIKLFSRKNYKNEIEKISTEADKKTKEVLLLFLTLENFFKAIKTLGEVPVNEEYSREKIARMIHERLVKNIVNRAEKINLDELEFKFYNNIYSKLFTSYLLNLEGCLKLIDVKHDTSLCEDLYKKLSEGLTNKIDSKNIHKVRFGKPAIDKLSKFGKELNENYKSIASGDGQQEQIYIPLLNSIYKFLENMYSFVADTDFKDALNKISSVISEIKELDHNKAYKDSLEIYKENQNLIKNRGVIITMLKQHNERIKLIKESYDELEHVISSLE